MSPDHIIAKIRAALPDATVELQDLTGTQDHWKATIVSAGFAGKSLLERHRLVMAALADGMTYEAEELTAVQLERAVGAIDGDRYSRWFATLPDDAREEVEGAWGPAPGTHRIHAGQLVFSGLEKMNNPFTMDGQPATGPLSSLHMRAAASVDYEIVSGLAITATPIAYAYSPAPKGFAAGVSTLTTLSFLIGVGYRQ